MEGSCSTGQSPQQAVVSVEEEEEEEDIARAKLIYTYFDKMARIIKTSGPLNVLP
jgi:hypothetical protein